MRTLKLKVIKRFSPSNTKDSDQPAMWKITSNWSDIATVRQYLILKWIFDELSKNEYYFLLDTINPLFDHFMIAFKLFHKLRKKKLVQKAYNRYYSKIEEGSMNKQVYKLLKAEAGKSLKLELFYTRRRKGKKYSGWRRSHNDHGSIGAQVNKDFEYLVPQDEENLENSVFNKLLSVLESRTISEYLGLMMTQKRVETGNILVSVKYF